MIAELFMVLMLVPAPAPPPGDALPPVIEGAGLSVSRDEFLSAWEALPLAVRADYAVKPDGKAEFLLAYLRESVFAQAALDQGLAQDPSIQATIQAARRSILAQAYIARRLHDPLLNEDALQKQYAQVKADFLQQGWYEARQILVTPKPTAGLNNLRKDDATDNAGARKKALKIEKLLAAGQPFETLAREYSEDPATCLQGGDLGRFGKGMMTGRVEEALDGLDPGRNSGIVESPYGLHLLHLVAVQRQEPIPIDRLRPLLSHQILMREGGVLLRQENELFEELKKNYGILVDWDWVRHLP